MATVADIMQRQVVTVAPTDTVRELVQVLAGAQISGAPVVEADGRVVGVVSASDVMRFAASEAEVPLGDSSRWDTRRSPEEEQGHPDEALLDYFRRVDREARWTADELSMLTVSAFDQVTVRDIMTPATFRVRPAATIAELARFLVRAGIHRALVIENHRLTGIVSSVDVLRTIAREDDEAEGD